MRAPPGGSAVFVKVPLMVLVNMFAQVFVKISHLKKQKNNNKIYKIYKYTRYIKYIYIYNCCILLYIQI